MVIFGPNTSRVFSLNLLLSNFDIRTIEVGLSLPPLQRAGSTREQGLHAKDSKMQNKAEQSVEKVARKGDFNSHKMTTKGIESLGNK